jgi:hypothetical protein
MAFNGFDNQIARLVILQRIELATPLLVKIRKLFGRYLFTNFFSNFLLSRHKINHQYYNNMLAEYNSLKKYINFTNANILSIGAGMCGLELIINSYNDGNQFSIVEKNYVSKKIRYGWDDKNFEVYNAYFKKIFSDKTQIVFDTIRPNYFKKLFNKVEVISETKKRIHSSKRVICSEFIR